MKGTPHLLACGEFCSFIVPESTSGDASLRLYEIFYDDHYHDIRLDQSSGWVTNIIPVLGDTGAETEEQPEEQGTNALETRASKNVLLNYLNALSSKKMHKLAADFANTSLKIPTDRELASKYFELLSIEDLSMIAATVLSENREDDCPISAYCNHKIKGCKRISWCTCCSEVWKDWLSGIDDSTYLSKQ